MALQASQDAKAGLGPGVTTHYSLITVRLQSGAIGDTKSSTTYDLYVGRAGDATHGAKEPSTVEMEGPEGSIATDRKLSAEYTAHVLTRSRACSTILPSDVDPEAWIASQDSRHRSESVAVHGAAARHLTNDTEEPLAPETDIKKGGRVELTPPGLAVDGGQRNSATAEEISDANLQRSMSTRARGGRPGCHAFHCPAVYAVARYLTPPQTRLLPRQPGHNNIRSNSSPPGGETDCVELHQDDEEVPFQVERLRRTAGCGSFIAAERAGGVPGSPATDGGGEGTRRGAGPRLPLTRCGPSRHHPESAVQGAVPGLLAACRGRGQAGCSAWFKTQESCDPFEGHGGQQA